MRQSRLPAFYKEWRKEYRKLKRNKKFQAFQIFLIIYLFIFAIFLMKLVAEGLGRQEVRSILLSSDNALAGFAGGWLSAELVQSASVIAILTSIFLGTNLLDLSQAFYIMLGLIFGNSFTPLIASVLSPRGKYERLYYGFELALANIIYNLHLIFIVFILEKTTYFYTYTGQITLNWFNNIPFLKNIPDLIGILVTPLKFLFFIDYWPLLLIFIFSIFLFILSMNLFGDLMANYYGGVKRARKKIQTKFSSDKQVFGFGLVCSLMIPSASLLVTIIVPLAVKKIVTLRQAIPYIIAVNIGTYFDVLLAGFASGIPGAIAGSMTLILISLTGFLFIIKGIGVGSINFVTQFLTQRLLKIHSRFQMTWFALGYILVPISLLLLALLF
ncbi:hypothetical protein E3983_03455 [Legionella israelensis]|uniref:Uncharacterized protein n=1 Tax=Legionella israelensis TaxID=454 RepID=A0AAX1EEG6_9GAMM|nr:hypothetical protein [Legionella israelensis]QBR83501.1 hypothetical protein E3983_03455 [Legionella israelensis]